MQQNKSTFSFPFKGVIWKLLIDVSSNVLVIETRDGESREVDFTGIDTAAGKVLWQGADTNEKWWIGLEEAKYGKAVLHGYKDSQNPEHKGLVVLDIRNGKVIWQNESLSFFSMTDKTLIAYEQEGEDRKFKEIDLRNGKITGQIAESQLSPENKKEALIKNSGHYTADNKYFEKIAGFAEMYAGKLPEQALDYLEYEGKIITSFYSKEGEKLVNYLIVVDEEGNLVYKELIDTDLKGVGIDTFFLYKDLLIFIKMKKELVIFEL